VKLAVGQIWDGSRLAAWRNQSAPTDALGQRAREVIYQGRRCLALTCFAADVYPRTPNSNPRAQLAGDWTIDVGGTYLLDATMVIPAGAIPAAISRTGGQWIEFLQVAYGQPYAGSPPLRFMTQDGVSFGLREADASTYAWQAPLERDVFYRLVVEWKQDATTGWYRLSVGKAGTDPVEVVPKKAYATVQASNGGDVNFPVLDAYMQLGSADRLGPVLYADLTVTRTA
jgi:hypothetical protein